MSARGAASGQHRLPKRQRLRHGRQFKELYTRGHRLRGPHLTIFFQRNALPYSRLGLSVTKKRFKLSTTRHYIQRRLRRAFQEQQTRFLCGFDLVIQAHNFVPGQTDFAEIGKELWQLAQKARLLKALSDK